MGVIDKGIGSIFLVIDLSIQAVEVGGSVSGEAKGAAFRVSPVESLSDIRGGGNIPISNDLGWVLEEDGGGGSKIEAEVLRMEIVLAFNGVESVVLEPISDVIMPLSDDKAGGVCHDDVVIVFDGDGDDNLVEFFTFDEDERVIGNDKGLLGMIFIVVKDGLFVHVIVDLGFIRDTTVSRGKGLADVDHDAVGITVEEASGGASDFVPVSACGIVD